MVKENKWYIPHFKAPKRLEIGLLVLAFFLFAVSDWSQNLVQIGVQNFGELPLEVMWGGISAITIYWISTLLYALLFFIVAFRSFDTGRTHYMLDFVFGGLGLFAIYGLISGAVAGFYFGANESIPWLLNLAQITGYHIFVGFTALAYLYFMLTD